MTVYNGMPYLVEAVESTLNQTCHDFEFLIIDDASTDNSFDYLNNISDKRIKLIKNAENMGQVKSLNRGLVLCEGDLVARLDQDDVNLPHRLEEQINFFNDNPNISLICSYEHTIDSKGVKILDWKKNINNYGQFIAEIILGKCPVWHPSVMYKKDVVEKLGYYNTQYGLSEDYDLWAKFALNRYEAAIVSKFHLLQREHDDRQSISSGGKQQKALTDIHQNVINHFCDDRKLNSCISSFLRLEKDHCGNGFNGEHLKDIIINIKELFTRIEKVTNLSISEKKIFMRTVSRRLGYGIKIGCHFIFLPNLLFNGLFFTLSPMYFFKIRKLFSKTYRKLRELKYINNSLLPIK